MMEIIIIEAIITTKTKVRIIEIIIIILYIIILIKTQVIIKIIPTLMIHNKQ